MPEAPAPSPTGTDPSITGDSSAPIPELVALGQSITSARKARGLELVDLAERLCIGHEQLQALENADTSRLPELVFVIAQVRRVAASLGLDAEEAVTALRASAPARTAQTRLSPPQRPRAGSGQPGRALSPARSGVPERSGITSSGAWLTGAGLLLTAAAVGLALLWHRGASAPGSDGSPGNRPPLTNTVAATGPSGRLTSAAAARASAPAGPARLVLRSREASWLEVRDNQGNTLFEGTLEGEKSFPLGQGLRVMAGRPDLVQAEVSGQEPRLLGTIDQVIWRSFTASAAATAAAAPPVPAKAPAP